MLVIYHKQTAIQNIIGVLKDKIKKQTAIYNINTTNNDNIVDICIASKASNRLNALLLKEKE
jgi:hypothetical protein